MRRIITIITAALLTWTPIAAGASTWTRHHPKPKLHLTAGIRAGFLADADFAAIFRYQHRLAAWYERRSAYRQAIARARAALRRAAEIRRAAQAAISAPPPLTPSTGINWLGIANCESGGDWAANTGNGYEGGLQFVNSTWLSAGGGQYAPHAYMATASQQIATANRWVSMVGCYWCSAGWPYCGRFG